MNLKEITRTVTLQQRARRPQENLSNARTDQVLKLHRRELARHSDADVIRMLERERKQMAKEAAPAKRGRR